MKTNQARILTALITLVAAASVLVLALFGPAIFGFGANEPDERTGPDARPGEQLAAGDVRTPRDMGSAQRSIGFYSAPVGREFVFDTTGRSTTRLELMIENERVEESVEHVVESRMQVFVAARLADELVAVFSFPDAIIAVAGGQRRERDTALEAAASQPCFVRMGDDGRLLGFRFDASVSPAARNWVRSRIAAFHFEVEGPHARTWERVEQDPTGTSRVRYVRASPVEDETLRLEKSKLDVTIRPGGGGVPLDVQAGVRAFTSGELSRSLGWVRTARFDESLTIPVADLGVTTHVVQSGTLALVSDGWRRIGSIPSIDWAEPWSSVSGIEDVEAMGAGGDEMLRARELEGVTLEALLLEIEALVRAEPRDVARLMDARHTLAELMIHDAGTVAALAPLIHSMSPATAHVVLGAAGAAGTEPAQRLLADVLTDTRMPAATRQSSLDSMFQLARPVAECYGAVERIVSDTSAGASLRSNGLLVLGALSSMEPAGAGDRTALVEKVVALERQARDDNRLEHWLHALGNTRSPAVFEAARPYLDSADATLRRAAVEAVSSSEAAVPLLAQRALSDSSASVRRACAAVLADGMDDASRSAVRRILQHEPAVEVRRAAVDVLARRVKKDADARALLQHVAGNDPSADLRARAAGAL